jgi:hypothetical protein
MPQKVYEIGTVATPKLEKRLGFAITHPKATFSEA